MQIDAVAYRNLTFLSNTAARVDNFTVRQSVTASLADLVDAAGAGTLVWSLQKGPLGVSIDAATGTLTVPEGFAARTADDAPARVIVVGGSGVPASRQLALAVVSYPAPHLSTVGPVVANTLVADVAVDLAAADARPPANVVARRHPRRRDDQPRDGRRDRRPWHRDPRRCGGRRRRPPRHGGPGRYRRGRRCLPHAERRRCSRRTARRRRHHWRAVDSEPGGRRGLSRGRMVVWSLQNAPPGVTIDVASGVVTVAECVAVASADGSVRVTVVGRSGVHVVLPLALAVAS